MSVDVVKVRMSLFRAHEAVVDELADATTCFLRDVGLVIVNDDYYKLKDELARVLTSWVKP